MKKQNVFGTGTPNTAYAKYFIGESYLNSLTKPTRTSPLITLNLVAVTTDTSHHAKSGGGQLLICTAKAGRVGIWREEGKEPVSLTPGKGNRNSSRG